MKKYLYLIIFMFLFIPGLNAATVERLDFGEYSDYELIEVTELPTVGSSTLNKVYKLNDKYYISTVEVIGSKIYLAPNSEFEISNTNYRYLYYDYDYSNNTDYNFCTGNYNVNISAKRDTLYNWSSVTFFSITPTSVTLNIVATGYTYDGLGNKEFVMNSSNYTYDTSLYFSGSVNLHMHKFVNAKDCYVPLYVIPEVTEIYSWEEIFPKIIVDYISVDRDFYLFYNFEDIRNFDILQNYDLLSFNDFQKIVVTLGFNTFYLGFIGFIIYIFLKLLYKSCSFIKQFF